MAAVLCWFFPHRLKFVFDAMLKIGERSIPTQYGVFQCTRCKTVKLGEPRHK